jgi:hypothetical protein
VRERQQQLHAKMVTVARDVVARGQRRSCMGEGSVVVVLGDDHGCAWATAIAGACPRAREVVVVVVIQDG